MKLERSMFASKYEEIRGGWKQIGSLFIVYMYEICKNKGKQ